MSGIIHFSSGKTLEITEREFQMLPPKLGGRGIKVVQTSGGNYIPLNSNTMEYVEHVPEDIIIEEPPIAVDKAFKEAEKVLGNNIEKKEKPKSLQERKDEAMEELIAKSDCKHESDKSDLYIQHTAKGVRYF